MPSSRSWENCPRNRREVDAVKLTLTHKTKVRVPALPFLRMKNAILGTAYDCSLVIIDDAESRRLNLTYRKKTYTPNVLAFPLAKDVGEIFLNMKEAGRQYASPSGIAKTEGLTLRSWVALLVIHAMLHLKGLRHGRTMERAEREFVKEFAKTPPRRRRRSA